MVDKMMFKAMAIILLLISIDVHAAMVVDVTDGDTLKVVDENGMTTIRLYGVDSPEKKQAQGLNARRFVETMVAGKNVDITPVGIDRYGRTVAVVMLGDQCVQEQLLVSGYAWVYPQYCRKQFCTAWATLQRISAENKWGLWSDPLPVQPWVWRKLRP
jgi:endonuclease YncB( thermonuclease family)